MNDEVKDRNPLDVKWPETPGEYLILGEIGVDSASISIGDRVMRDQVLFYTPEGDGRFAVYARKIDGRRCVVIDLDALVDHDIGKIRKTTSEWRCPDCGGEEISGGTSNESMFFTCANGHNHEVKNAIIESKLSNTVEKEK